MWSFSEFFNNLEIIVVRLFARKTLESIVKSRYEKVSKIHNFWLKYEYKKYSKYEKKTKKNLCELKKLY